jgi:hypothetical protein
MPGASNEDKNDENHIFYPETRTFDSFRRHFLSTQDPPESSHVDFFGTIKIHGSNISLIFTNDDQPCRIQSRNRILSPDSDLYDCHRSLSRAPLNDLVSQIATIYSDPWTEIMVVAEWAGKGIMKGVGTSLVEPKFLTIFNIRIERKWQDIRKYRTVALRDHRIYNICDFPSYSITIDLRDLNDVERADQEMDALVAVIDKKCPVAAYFGIDGPGEGIVYTYIPPQTSYHLYNFKVKSTSHQIVRKSTVVDAKTVGLTRSVDAFVQYCITPARLDQGISYLEEMGKQIQPSSTGDYIRWVVRDALNEEGYTLEERNLKEKDVKQALTIAVRRGWEVRLKAALRAESGEFPN